MLHVRTTKTASGATAVQVVSYRFRKMIVQKHFGSAHTDKDIIALKNIASRWIEQTSRQQLLFPAERHISSLPLVPLDKLRNLGFYYTFAYETISKLLQLFSYSQIDNRLLLDLVLIRIIQPASKSQSLRLLAEFFAIKHHRTDFYRNLQIIIACKQTAEEKTIEFAKKHFAFDFSLVFYDVTTLYYESFTEDEDTFDTEGNITVRGLRRTGFSKDNKHKQPQILIGLIVNQDGFPVAYEIFEGNTFEGDTFIPIIWQFKRRYNIETLTVVADAAMISFENLEKLKEKNLAYIVGARVGNLSIEQISEVRQALIGETVNEEGLKIKDKQSCRIVTDKGILICDFSYARYLKDKREMEKQIIRAENLIAKNTDETRTKFMMLKKDKKDKKKKKKKKGKKGKKEKTYMLNTELIEKTKLLLGIKGYYTNLFEKDQEITDRVIIERYHNLWHVEKAFRIAKSDLQIRPVYSFKKKAIEAHVLICFMALAICQYMELKTGKSTKKIVGLLKKITDARLLNIMTNEEIIIRSELSTEIEELLKKLLL